MHIGSREARRGLQILWEWRYRRLWAAIGLLGNKLKSSRRTESILHLLTLKLFFKTAQVSLLTKDDGNSSMQSLEINLIKSQVGSMCLNVRGSLLFIITVETSERLSIAPEKSFLTFVPRCASGRANFLQAWVKVLHLFSVNFW